MIFSLQLATKVLEGVKTTTRRRITHRDGRPLRYQAGKSYAVQPGRGKPHVGHIKVWSVEVQPLGALLPSGARDEGFLTVGDFNDYWGRLHGGYDRSEPVAVIKFFVTRRCAKCRSLTAAA